MNEQTPITFIALCKGATPEMFGIIPSFLDDHDPRPARDQFDERYQGGWQHQSGVTIDGMKMCYPGDPPQMPIAALRWRSELIVLYPYEYIAIVQPDGSYECCRMD